MRWRLKRRPYAAIVVAQGTFDALAWFGETNEALPLNTIVADGKHLAPTGATFSGGDR